jgi:hypothetical protein
VNDQRKSFDDEGITLIELLITTLLSTVVLILIGSFFIQMVNATTKSNETRLSTATASDIAAELSDVIRPASPLVIAGATKPAPAVIVGGPNELVIYTYADSVASDIRPIRVRFSLDAKSRLVESRWSATVNASTGLWNFPTLATAPTSSRTLPGTIVPASALVGAETTASAPLFTYFDEKSAPIVPVGGAMTAAQLEAVASVRFTLRVRPSAATKAQVVTIQNVVGMPNLGL